LPGLGPAAAMSLMLPFSVTYGPLAGLIMLSGVWYGAMYGGSTTSILVNIPGEAASVITCIEGYQMTKKGRAGAALSLVAIGSWVAGTVALIGLQFFAPVIGKAAFYFGPAEYLFLLIFAFTAMSSLTSDGGPSRGFLMLALGLFLGVIGIDPIFGIPRYTLNTDVLMDGINLVPVAVGLFGISEIINVAINSISSAKAEKVRLRDLYPNREEVNRSIMPTIRGSGIGFMCGLIPGPAPIIATFLSYSVEKRISKRPEEFGKGAVEGLVGPESANNGAVIASLIPLLSLGIPFSPPAAILLAGLRLHNVNPGPMLFQNAPELFWGFVASMYIANVLLLVFNLPLVGIFSKVATAPAHVLIPLISIMCLIGGYSVRNSMFDVYLMIIFGIVGFIFQWYRFPVVPIIIGLVLGPMLEINFRLTLKVFSGNLWGVMTRPIVLVFLVLTIILPIVAMKFKHKGMLSEKVS
jgi:putative tricarboxylic transport membrane protein